MTDLRYIHSKHSSSLRLLLRHHQLPGSGQSGYCGKYFIIQVDVPPCVTFKGNSKGFPSGTSFPSDKVDIDEIESYGGVGVVNRGYGRTCRWVRVGDPFWRVWQLCVVLLLQAKLEQRKAGLL